MNLSSLEQKYQQQIKEQNETHQKLYSDLLAHTKDLERELKSVNYQSELKSKVSETLTNLQRKISEMSENNEKL